VPAPSQFYILQSPSHWVKLMHSIALAAPARVEGMGTSIREELE
jgi:hypothetical protein